MITGNEPARPATDVNNETGGFIHYGGLTIRQHFVAMAMQGILSSSADRGVNFVVSQSVKIADALITELNKTNI